MQALHYRCYSAQPSSGVWVKFLQIDSFHQCRASCAPRPAAHCPHQGRFHTALSTAAINHAWTGFDLISACTMACLKTSRGIMGPL